MEQCLIKVILFSFLFHLQIYSSLKRRPIIVISNDTYNRRGADMVVVAMTSTPFRSRYSFTITSDNLDDGRLNHPGTVRVDKIYTLDQKLAIKTFGRVSN